MTLPQITVNIDIVTDVGRVTVVKTCIYFNDYGIGTVVHKTFISENINKGDFRCLSCYSGQAYANFK